jgi:hypothetical protein
MRRRQGGNFLPTPGFAQVWGNGVRKWLLCADFRDSTQADDELRRNENPSVDEREYRGYSVILNLNLGPVGASAASGIL